MRVENKFITVLQRQKINYSVHSTLTPLHHRHKFLVIDAPVAILVGGRNEFLDVAQVGSFDLGHFRESLFRSLL